MSHPAAWRCPQGLAEGLEALGEAGAGALVSLSEVPLPRTAVEGAGMWYCHIPVADMAAPTQEQLDEFCAFVRRAHDDGRAVAVHCGAGLGRTGTMLAAYLVGDGVSPGEAIRRVRGARPGSVETAEQEAAVWRFSDRGRQN